MDPCSWQSALVYVILVLVSSPEAPSTESKSKSTHTKFDGCAEVYFIADRKPDKSKNYKWKISLITSLYNSWQSLWVKIFVGMFCYSTVTLPYRRAIALTESLSEISLLTMALFTMKEWRSKDPRNDHCKFLGECVNWALAVLNIYCLVEISITRNTTVIYLYCQTGFCWQITEAVIHNVTDTYLHTLSPTQLDRHFFQALSSLLTYTLERKQHTLNSFHGRMCWISQCPSARHYSPVMQ